VILNIVSQAVDEENFPESNKGKINQWQRGKTRPEILGWFWNNLQN
jgi:hypothetical protein